MTYRIFRCIAIVVTGTICVTILSLFFFSCLIPWISDIKVYLGKTFYTKGFAAPAIKASHFVIKIEKNDFSLYINGEAQFKYTPKTIIEGYSVSFFYPGNINIISDKAELNDLQIDTWTSKK